jgi:hypothetical protein
MLNIVLLSHLAEELLAPVMYLGTCFDVNKAERLHHAKRLVTD